ncbi:1-acyl-sn-glycerol-3-phosphate acyltransferase [candidate division KSB1 bacterium]|nr:1-acyl-sn-glycerol-3-phosphate acyltransferase [candidate division KSB1 bacterium]
METNRYTKCSICHAVVRRKGDQFQINDVLKSIPEWYRTISLIKFPDVKFTGIHLETDEELQFVSREAVLRELRYLHPWRPYPGIYALLYQPVEIETGRYAVTDKRVLFLSNQSRVFPLQDVSCVTTNSHYFVFHVAKGKSFQIKFKHESPFQYEEWTRRVLKSYWKTKGRDKIEEFQPRLIFDRPKTKSFLIKAKSEKIRQNFLEKFTAFFLKSVFGILFRVLLSAQVLNKKFIPKTGACIFIFNHTSYWDPFLAQSLLPRKIAFFAKNSEFVKPGIRYVLKIMRAIPVKRYTIDPSAIRNAATWLNAGEAVGIFVEGERSWDGRPQSSKYGTVKFLLASGVPLIPVYIDGAFKVQPRWDEKIQLNRVKLIVGEPMVLDPHKDTFNDALNKIDRAVRGPKR